MIKSGERKRIRDRIGKKGKKTRWLIHIFVYGLRNYRV